MKFPQKLDDFDETQGVEFLIGRWGDVTVETFKIYRNALQLDTRVSTAESQRIIEEGLAWASSAFGLKYGPTMIKRWGYVSNLTFYSEVPILKASIATSNLAQGLHTAIGKVNGDTASWESTVFTLHSDPVPKKALYAPFTIQRRADVPFSENKYFSEAPLQTDAHIALLEQFEADVKDPSD